MRSEQLNGAISKVEDEHVNLAQSEATSTGTNDKHLALDIQAACPEVPRSRRPLPRKIQSHVDVEKLNGNCITSSPLQDCSEVINAVPVVSSTCKFATVFSQLLAQLGKSSAKTASCLELAQALVQLSL